MMHLVTIFNDGAPTVIHGEWASVSGARIKRERNCTDSLELTIYPDNPGYSLLLPFATTVEVTDVATGVLAFEGRLITSDPSMRSTGLVSRSCTFEAPMGYLNDSVQPYLEERQWEGSGSANGLQEYIDFVLANHNRQVEEYKRVYRGVVDLVTYETSEGVYKGVNREKTWAALKAKLLDVFGGEMRVRRGDDGLLYLDYSERLGRVRQTAIEVARNMVEGSRKVSPNRLVTRLYPLGCKLTEQSSDEGGNVTETETEVRLTIASANGGIEYVDDVDAVREYGIIEGVETWDDVTDPANLMAKGREWLRGNNNLPVTTTLSVLDLSLIGLDYEGFELHDWYPCKNELIDLDELLEVVGQTIDLDKPQKSTLTFGETGTRQTRSLAALSNLAGQVDVIRSQQKTIAVNVRNSVRTVMTAIEVGDEEIRSTVGEQIQETRADLDGKLVTVSESVSEIRQTVDSISLSVAGTLGGTASIVMSVGGAEKAAELDLGGVRKAFQDDESAISISAGTVAFNANTFIVNSDHFSVTKEGVITATSGTVGGFTIADKYLRNDGMRLFSAGVAFSDGGVETIVVGATHPVSDESKKSAVLVATMNCNWLGFSAEFTDGVATQRFGWSRDDDRMVLYCDLDGRNHVAKNLYLDVDSCGFSGGKSVKTLNFCLPTVINSDGTIGYHYHSCYLEFKYGVLVGYSLPIS